MYISAIKFSNFNFGEKRIDSFSKEDLQKCVDNEEHVEAIASKFKCSIATVKRRAREWGVQLYHNNNHSTDIYIPDEDLLRSNDPNVRIEDVCTEYGCSRKTLTDRKKEAGIPFKTKKEPDPLSQDILNRIMSGENVGKLIKESGLPPTTFYRKLRKSLETTPHKQTLEAAKKINSDEISQMRARGMSTKEIADFYHVSETTILRHSSCRKK